ncbi:ribosomal protein L24 [Mycoplasma haemofelis str. Langford 1]|uniref:Large ribosomal subunit protein uL24 n=2 Tax=Mycoplasma haemofelis TaxID=29501 RepID=F6FHC4_MYCHI|nr:50S ribosomal protein L24 [Mycoplasma haemofelis]AEG73754.1 50S ribosomal protein L24 [Mycoplasma haemofelis Ohio2]CBY93459.1 ribosomal protein L24 [Mycoplasma haemofelis str. Langford 1]
MNKICRKDKVKVIYGKNKGAIGVVTRVFPSEGKIIVEGVNKVRRHKKGSEEGSIEKEAPLHISKVVLLDPKTDKPVKIRFEVKDGKKIRVNKKTGEEVPKLV